MNSRPRFFSSQLPRRQRLVYGLATAWFVLVALAMLWPVYPMFSRVRPFVLGMPASLAYLATLLVASFGVALALYLWEERHSLIQEPGSPLPEPGGDGDSARHDV